MKLTDYIHLELMEEAPPAVPDSVKNDSKIQSIDREIAKYRKNKENLEKNKDRITKADFKLAAVNKTIQNLLAQKAKLK